MESGYAMNEEKDQIIIVVTLDFMLRPTLMACAILAKFAIWTSGQRLYLKGTSKLITKIIFRIKNHMKNHLKRSHPRAETNKF